MRIKIKPGEFYHLINHGPCPLMTTGDVLTKNIAPIAWTMPLNDEPPLIATAIADEHYTATLLKKSGEFVINIAGESLAEKVYSCGKCHGDKTDKFKKFHLTPVSSSCVKTPYLKESIAHIECRLLNQHAYEGVTLYVGKVLQAEVEEDFWNGKSIVIEKAKTIHHLTGNLFTVTERVIEVRKM